MNSEIIKKLIETQEGRELQAFIMRKIKSLDRVSDIEGKNTEEIALETLARKRAGEKLVEILSPFIEVEEDREIDKPEVY